MRKYLTHYKEKPKTKSRSNSKHLRVKSQDNYDCNSANFQNFTRAYFSNVVIQVTILKKNYQFTFEKNTHFSIIKETIQKSVKPKKQLIICSRDNDYIFDYQFHEGIGFLNNHKKLTALTLNQTLPKTGNLFSYKICGCFSLGGFSKVYLLRSLRTGDFFAGKFIDKSPQGQARLSLINNEKQINQILDHPFIVKMHDFIEVEEFFVLILDYCSSGQLFSLMKAHRNMTQSQAKFYFIEVLLAIEYLHEMKIVYRDLKPQNIVLDKNGHVKLTDFGLAKLTQQRCYSYCGSLQYMAPQVINRQGHSFGIDYYSLGILLYEMMVGCPPFYDPHFSSKQTKFQILHGEVKFPQNKILSSDFKNLILKLLNKDENLRLGCCHGIKQILAHPWIGKINRKDFEEKKIKAPFIPQFGSKAFDTKALPQEQIYTLTKKLQKNIQIQKRSAHIFEKKNKSENSTSVSRSAHKRSSSLITLEFKHQEKVRNSAMNVRNSEISEIKCKFMKKQPGSRIFLKKKKRDSDTNFQRFENLNFNKNSNNNRMKEVSNVYSQILKNNLKNIRI